MSHPLPLLTGLLSEVSRSFYLTLRILPGAVRPQLSLAYLLARATDTVADTELVPLPDRSLALQQLQERIAGNRPAVDLQQFVRNQSSAAEGQLLARFEELIAHLEQFAVTDRARIRGVLNTITSGQQLDLRRFAGASGSTLLALRTEEELDDYTYRVAGCVGEFWTRITRAHVFPNADVDEEALVQDGIRFGKGLQLVNILRDIPADLRQGRCYLPEEQLAQAGMRPIDLLDPATEPRFRPLYNVWLERAWSHLACGWAYTNALPWRTFRLRLASAWPVLIGAETLQQLSQKQILDPAHRIKISRGRVKKILASSIVYYPWSERWRRLFPHRTVQ